MITQKEIKQILIKFREWQLNNNVLNANCAHNSAANRFIRNEMENDKAIETIKLK